MWFHVTVKQIGALLVFCCVKQKRTGELCCGVIRASGYTDNRFFNVLCKQDKGALLHFPRHWGDNSHHGCFVMCLAFSAYLFPVTSRLQSVRPLSFEDFRQSVCAVHCPPSLLSSTCSLVIRLHLRSLSFLQKWSISSVTSLACTACAKWRCYWGYTEFTL